LHQAPPTGEWPPAERASAPRPAQLPAPAPAPAPAKPAEALAAPKATEFAGPRDVDPLLLAPPPR
jgi:hypothetical protein